MEKDMDTQQLVQQLTTGFAMLQEDYAQLFAQHRNLERKLATAREQVSAHHRRWRLDGPV